jgi:redox-sensitive bicupin YhaK (pirin superfamily)
MIELVIEPRRRDLGGFRGGRVLPPLAARMVRPLRLLRPHGAGRLPAGLARETDVRPHPHIGLSTVTYLFDGEIMHRDSVGSEQPIRAGEVNWMWRRASRIPSASSGPARGRPAARHPGWVALPAEREETDPAFFHHDAAELPTLDDGDGAHGADRRQRARCGVRRCGPTRRCSTCT